MGSSKAAQTDRIALARGDTRSLFCVAATDNGSICATAMPRTRYSGRSKASTMTVAMSEALTRTPTVTATRTTLRERLTSAKSMSCVLP